MPRLFSSLQRLFTVGYRPHPEETSFVARKQTKSQDGLEVSAAVLSDHESRRHFGVRLNHRGLQPVWIHCVNNSDRAYRLDFFGVDPAYYTPLEAAGICHFSLGHRLAAMGLLSFLYLPLLLLLPFKMVSARRANRRMDALFKQEGFRFGPIPPGSERAGVVFTHIDEGNKNITVEFAAQDHVSRFDYSLEVPGLAIRAAKVDEAQPLSEVTEADLKQWIQRFARCTTNKRGTAEGDPLNLVVIGDRELIRQCLGGRWDETEAISLATCIKTGKAFLFDAEYRYSPVSSLYVNGRMQDLALQKARASINERIHLRLWRTELSFQRQPVWIGQISRDIGVRFTPRTWNLTTHRIDPDVDEARDYLMDSLLEAGRVSQFGYAAGVGPAPEEAPRHNLTGDPYSTDGLRAVLVLSPARTQPTFIDWR